MLVHILYILSIIFIFIPLGVLMERGRVRKELAKPLEDLKKMEHIFSLFMAGLSKAMNNHDLKMSDFILEDVEELKDE